MPDKSWAMPESRIVIFRNIFETVNVCHASSFLKRLFEDFIIFGGLHQERRQHGTQEKGNPTEKGYKEHLEWWQW